MGPQPTAEPGRLAVALSALLPTLADPVWQEWGCSNATTSGPLRPAAGRRRLLAQIDLEFTYLRRY